MKFSPEIVIVGAGLSGLALAHYLKKNGRKFLLIEKEKKAGGVIRSEAKSEFLVEAGPNSFLLKPELAPLIRELGLDSSIRYASPFAKKRFLGKMNGSKLELLAFPRSILEFISSPLLSLSAKARLLLEPFQSHSLLPDESVKGFSDRRFGVEFSERVLSTALTGVYAGNISSLSAREVLFPLWRMEREHGSIALGLFKKFISQQFGAPKPKIVNFKGGLSELAQAFKQKLSADSLVLGAKVEGIKFNQETKRYDLNLKGVDSLAVDTEKIVFTNSLNSCEKLLKPISKQAAEFISRVPQSSVGMLHVAVPKEGIKVETDGFGFLLPADYPGVLLGAIYSSAIFPDTSPDKSKLLLTLFLGGAKNPEAANIRKEENINAALEELREILGLESSPEVISKKYWKDAIPNYGVGHTLLMKRIRESLAEHKHLYFLTNWDTCEYDDGRKIGGVSLSDRILAAKYLAEHLPEAKDSG